MIKCSECNHDISDLATNCPSCGAPQKPKAKGIGAGGWILIAFAVWVFYELTTIGSSTTPSPASPAGSAASTPAPPSGPLLEVQSWRCSKEYSYIFVTGEVKNISSQPLKSVLAVGEFRTKAGEFVKSADALLDYNPILPGQTSPFKAGTTDNPQIQGCQLAFKQMFGGGIAYAELPKKTKK